MSVAMQETLQIEILERLLDNKDFAAYLALLERKQQQAVVHFPARIVTEEDKALYNEQRGFIQGLLVARIFVVQELDRLRALHDARNPSRKE